MNVVKLRPRGGPGGPFYYELLVFEIRPEYNHGPDDGETFVPCSVVVAICITQRAPPVADRPKGIFIVWLHQCAADLAIKSVRIDNVRATVSGKGQ